MKIYAALHGDMQMHRIKSLCDNTRIVFDPTQFAQLLLDYAVQVESWLVEVEQVENMVLMYENMVLNIKNLDFNGVPFVGGMISTLRRVIDKAKGIGYNAETIIDEYQDLYPRFSLTGIEAPWTSEQFYTQQIRWNTQKYEAYQLVFQQTAEMANTRDIISAGTHEALYQSKMAVGNLAVQQAGNALLGIQNAQLMAIHEQLAIQARAEASRDMNEAAALNQVQLRLHAATDGMLEPHPTEGLSQLPTSFK